MHTSRTANLLGAAALAITERVLAESRAVADTSSTGAAVLVTLSTDPGLSITELSHRVGVSQPATTRTVERLERDGLVRREHGTGRTVAVHATARGLEAAASLLVSRGDALRAVVEPLDAGERAQLDQLLVKVLAGIYEAPGDAERLCRLCDRTACLAGGAVCPVGQADRDCRARLGDADG